jgi:hypothetical protein
MADKGIERFNELGEVPLPEGERVGVRGSMTLDSPSAPHPAGFASRHWELATRGDEMKLLTPMFGTARWAMPIVLAAFPK